MNEIAKVLFIFSVMFLLTIMGVTFIPTIVSKEVRNVFVGAIAMMSLSGMWLILNYQIQETRKICREKKKKEEMNK